MSRIFVALFTVFLLSCKQSPTESTNPYQAQIDSARSLVQQMKVENQIPGMAVAVSVDGKLVWSEGFGYSDIANRVPVDPAKTLFRIGSVSKTLTATAVGRLIQSGKLNVEAEVQQYVPDFPIKDFPITVKQVAGHIAGIRHYRDNEMLSDVFYPSVTDGLAIFKDDSLLFEPGADYSYSSYGWNLVSAVVEGASNQEFLSYMRENVFQPLQMTNTRADYATEEIPFRTKFYSRTDSGVVDAPYVDNSYKWAGGGFISSAEDLIKFGQAHMSPGFLDEKTLGELQTAQSLNDGSSTDYGIGWRSGYDERNKFYLGHSGGSIGGITQFWMYPNEKVIVAMVTNINPVSYKDTDTKIAWLFMEEQ